MASYPHPNSSASSELFCVGKSSLGRGLYARQVIEPGWMILEFVGPHVDFNGAMEKGETQCNVLQVDENLYIDIVEPGVLVNHSCQPNAGIVDSRRLVALQRIEPGSQITFDYSCTMGDSQWTMDCRCGTALCRGVVRDFEELPAHRQQHYVSLGIVQSYLMRRNGSKLVHASSHRSTHRPIDSSQRTQPSARRPGQLRRAADTWSRQTGRFENGKRDRQNVAS